MLSASVCLSACLSVCLSVHPVILPSAGAAAGEDSGSPREDVPGNTGALPHPGSSAESHPAHTGGTDTAADEGKMRQNIHVDAVSIIMSREHTFNSL